MSREGDERGDADLFAAGEPAREVALVALDAAALARRAFAAGGESDQLLLALALSPCVPVPALASMLALDAERGWELVGRLQATRLAEPCELPEEIEHEEIPGEEITWRLTARGEAEALEVARRVARVLPGWPPAARARGG